MVSSGPDEVVLPAKKMRLGTKSCAECRRRKIRCIFPSNGSVCEECAVHDVECKPQQPKGKQGAGDEDTEAMKKRLEEMERTVRQLSGALDTGEPSAIANARNTTASMLKHLASPPASTPSGAESQQSPMYSVTSPANSNRNNTAIGGNDASGLLNDAPLLHLFRDARLMQDNDGIIKEGRSVDLESGARIRDILQRLAPFIPAPDKLETIFAATENYWLIWPPYYLSAETSERLGPGNPAQSTQIIYTALGSAKAGVMAKACVWLALCTAQLPKSIFAQVKALMPQADLIELYLKFAKLFVEEDEEGGGTLEGCEAMNLLHKAYINLGRPKHSWNWTRRTVLSAINLGLHRATRLDNPHKYTMWSMTWGPERIMSVMLGLPTSVSAQFPGISRPDDASTALEKLAWTMATVAGKVIDRDQNRAMSNYAVTVQISHELEEARNLLPEEWWDKPPAGLPMAEQWHLQSCKFLYHIILKLTHLPYMLKAVNEPRYAHSWDMAMEASRCAARAYYNFRVVPKGETNLCQLQDFQAFSAVIVLIVGHLTLPRRGIDYADKDWELVQDIALALRQTATVLECSVAEQAARTLEVLIATRHGGYVATADYTVTIPYFGKLRINQDTIAGRADLTASNRAAETTRRGAKTGRQQATTSPAVGLEFDVGNTESNPTSESPRNRPRRLAVNTSAESVGQGIQLDASTGSGLEANQFGDGADPGMAFLKGVEFSTEGFAQDLPFKVDYTTELCMDWADPSLLAGDYTFDWTENFLT